MSNRLEGKIALITGGSSGIGFATAQLFVEEGAKVFMTGRRQAELDAAAEAIGGSVTAIRSDISNLADLDDLYARIKEEAGHLDIVFANAGVGAFAPLGAITEEQYDTTFDINVKGTLFTIQKALPLLKDGSSIVVNASVAGATGLVNFSVYGASKAAIRNFARSWILDLKARKIRVNVLSPGPIKTPPMLNLDANVIDEMASRNPLGRVGDPREAAQTALFLASDDSSFVNGVELFVDGGLIQTVF
jgi:NAD(P)-dependent dehydrogenase (short-subunit alcohol dehydrogenase family)